MLKTNILGVALLCACASMTAQTQEKEVFKSFVDEKSGTTYWNRNQPAYFNLSTQPNGEGSTTGVSQDKAKIEKPYYFDSEGLNYVRTRYQTDSNGKTILPKKDLLWPVQCDGLKPYSSIKFHFASKYKKGNMTYFDKSLTFSIKSTDKISGVARTMFSINGNDYKQYTTGEKLVLAKGENTIKAYSVDNVGNMENADKPSSNKSFTIDDQAPNTEYTITGPRLDNILSPKCKIKLKAQDDQSGVKHIKFATLNKIATKYPKTGISLSNLEKGKNHVSYYSTDNVNNKETERKIDFYIDRKGPKVKFNINKDEYINSKNERFVSPRSEVVLQSEDNKAGVEKVHFGFKETDRKEYVQPIVLSKLKSLRNTFYYTATDKVKNKSKLKSFSFNIDRKGPNVNWSTNGIHIIGRNMAYITSKTKIKLTANDQGRVNSGVKNISYSISGTDEKLYDKAFTINEKDEVSLTVRGTDNVNNNLEKKFKFYVDDTPPEIYHHFSVSGVSNKKVDSLDLVVYPSNTHLFLAAKDLKVGNDKIYYRINGGEKKLYTQSIFGLKKNTNFTIDVIAVDLLGNESSKTVHFATGVEM